MYQLGHPEDVDAWTKPDSEDEQEYDSDDIEKEEDTSMTAPLKSKKRGKGNYINGYYHEIYRPDQPSKQQDVPVRDWNEEFQSILSDLSSCKGSEEEKLQLYNQLSTLAHGLLPFFLVSVN